MNKYFYLALLSLSAHAQTPEEVNQSQKCIRKNTNQADCKVKQSEQPESSGQTRDVDFEKIKNLTRPK